MAKKKNFYENVYTKQLDEAIFDQKGYDERKAEEKRKVQAENQRHKGLVRVFFFLCLLGTAVVSKKIIDMDPDNAGPLVIFFALVAVVYFFIRWINK